LYIDEATSGLDAGTESRMMRLFRAMADDGRSVICITHNVDNVDRCHLAAVLMRGRLVYLGPPAEAPAYFGVDRLSEVYDRLEEKESEVWEKTFTASSFHAQFVARRRTSPLGEPGGSLVPVAMPGAATSGLFASVVLSPPPAAAPRQRRFRSRFVKSRELWAALVTCAWQFRVLTARYAELLLGDRRSMALLWLQAPLVAVFILLGFSNKPYEQPLPGPQLSEPECQAVKGVMDMARQLPQAEGARWQGLEQVPLPATDGHTTATAADLARAAQRLDESRLLDTALQLQGVIDPRYNFMLLYILAITVMWFGCNNAAKEIVKEESIYGRERAVNLGIVPYLGSKFLVLSVVSAMQTLVLLGVVFGGLWLLHVAFGQEMPANQYRLGFSGEFGVLALLSMAGVACGLLLSACVSSPDRANALLPYVLIPQIILGGGMISVHHEPLHGLALVLSPVYWAYRGIGRGATSLPPEVPFHADYNDSVWIACAALATQVVVLLILTAWFLRRKDVGRG
jgi:hypothetical protein